MDQNDRCIKRELKVIQKGKGDSIIRSEFDKTLRELSRRNALEIDNLPSKLMKNAGENAINRFCELTCRMYEDEIMPKKVRANRYE